MDDQARPDGTGAAAGEQAAGDQQTAAAGVSEPVTGDARVDAAVRQLDRLTELPVGEHAPVFERVHAELTEVLGDLDLDSESAGTSG